MKIFKWVAGVFVVLVVIGAIFGSDDKSAGDGGASGADLAAVEGGSEELPTIPEVVEEATPEPTPEPLEVSVSGPSTTTRDQVTLRGRVAVAGTKVRVG